MLLDLFKPKDKKKQAFHHLRKRLHGHHQRAVSHLHAAHGHIAHLTQKHGVHIHKLRHHGQRAAATAVLSTSLLAAVPGADLAKQRLPSLGAETAVAQDATRLPQPEQVAQTLPDKPITDALKDVITDKPSPNFSKEQEAAVSQAFEQYYGIKAYGEMEGKRLNVVYGQMGGEQHLKRYPGDVAANHKNNIDTNPELAGVAPGLGGWGYFAPSKAAFDNEAYEREKFYIAAQTFAAPGWKENVMGMSRWFKFRKVLVVNPITGQGCVAVIGDAGPGLSTKKSFGGSPEVMDAVGHSRGSRKGPVIVYFVDDPENKIPLGHVNPGDYLKKK